MADEPGRRSILEIGEGSGPEATLVLSGELDPATAPELDTRIRDLVADDSVTGVVLDLAGVSFLDSSGVRVLVAGAEALRARSATFTLRRPSDNIRRVLEVTGLTQLIVVD